MEKDFLLLARLISFGQSVKRLRVIAGISQPELAIRANIPLHLLEDVEKGLSDSLLTTLSGLATALGIPMKDFFAD